MTHRVRAAAALLAICTIGMVACENTTSTSPLSPRAGASRSVTAQPDLGTEIQSLIATGYPKGRATAIGAMWDQVLRALAKDPKTTLKGKVVPGSSGRSELTHVASYIQLKTGDALPPAGETQAHFAARLVLDMSLYVYGGPATPVPVLAPNSDVALKVVNPGVTDTVVTPAKLAAVIFPSGGVSEATVVVVTPDTAYYPANCSGPLDTHLCQYPRFYRFNVFPDVKLGAPAKVQVCHVDAGSIRRPLADHDRFLIAHEKPANDADKSAGSVIVDNVEILAFAVMNVTTCPANGGTTYSPPASANYSALGRLQSAAMRVAYGVASVAHRLFVPKDAYAIDIGGGGFAEFFSTFAVVDPLSIPDLAQSTTSYFAPTMTTLVTGQAVPLQGWSVTNLGSGTSGAFTSQIIVATDSLLTSSVLTTQLGGASSLVPRANFSYAAQSVPMPTAPGTYFVGTRIVYSGADSTAADDLRSVRVVVTAANGNTYSLVSQGTDTTAWGGGTGGSPYIINCPSGSVAVGMTGTAGSYHGWASIFTVRLACAQLLPNGSLGLTSTTSAAGQFAGGAPFSGVCSGGGVLVGGAGHRSGNAPPLVADLSGSCASVATVVSLGGSDTSIGPWVGSGVNYQAPFALQCGPGRVVTGIQASAGEILDAIGFRCTPVAVLSPIY